MPITIPKLKMPSTGVLMIAGAALLLLLLVAVFPDLADAAPKDKGGPQDINTGGTSQGAQAAGSNLGEMLQSWGQPLLFGIAGLIGLVAVLKRDVGEGFKLLAVVLVAGAFIISPTSVGQLMTGIYQTLIGK